MDPRSVDGCWVSEWVDAGWAGDWVRQWQWILGEWLVNFVLLVGSPWHSDLSCALDVGRELSKLHSRDRAEANSMPSRRTYNCFDIMNKQLFFSPLYLCVNKLSDYKYATMLAHSVNKWFQAVHRDCFCYSLDWSSSCYKDEQGNLLVCTNTNAI